MNPFILHKNFSSKITCRNPKSSIYAKRIYLKEKLKTICDTNHPPTTPKIQKSVPILTFPLSTNKKNNNKHFSSKSLFLTSKYFYSYSLSKNNKILRTIMSNSTNYNHKCKTENNKSIKKIVENRFIKPVIVSKTIENKIKESKKTKKLKKLNILDFGNNLKLYDEFEKKQKEKTILEKRTRELDEMYCDCDKKNRKIIMNSFSGNRADLLRNKIFFVKGIVDFLYPKYVLTKMDYINEIKENNYKEERKKMLHNFKSKFYISKHKNPQQTVAMSKYLYGGQLDIIRPREIFINLKKTLINKSIVSKLANDYDFI